MLTSIETKLASTTTTLRILTNTRIALEYNWANWDIEGWLAKMCPADESLWDNVKLARISFDNVFR